MRLEVRICRELARLSARLEADTGNLRQGCDAVSALRDLEGKLGDRLTNSMRQASSKQERIDWGITAQQLNSKMFGVVPLLTTGFMDSKVRSLRNCTGSQIPHTSNYHQTTAAKDRSRGSQSWVSNDAATRSTGLNASDLQTLTIMRIDCGFGPSPLYLQAADPLGSTPALDSFRQYLNLELHILGLTYPYVKLPAVSQLGASYLRSDVSP
ncbi:hypothetical protein RRG08_028931 [Elysia crispata]|uniref:Uncharacterized protein n=1 Tax=Elysia crispata TaxID=231223 RepID=A0AAE1AQ06_9GAST|nr:hypothetical protein RRG08_028931 [Elysia crispata]